MLDVWQGSEYASDQELVTISPFRLIGNSTIKVNDKMEMKKYQRGALTTRTTNFFLTHI